MLGKLCVFRYTTLRLKYVTYIRFVNWTQLLPMFTMKISHQIIDFLGWSNNFEEKKVSKFGLGKVVQNRHRIAIYYRQHKQWHHHANIINIFWFIFAYIFNWSSIRYKRISSNYQFYIHIIRREIILIFKSQRLRPPPQFLFFLLQSYQRLE